MARPSFQFYPGDYLTDFRLRQCSVESRGVWMDMLCMMHQGSPYGYLRDESGDVTVKALAKLTTLSASRLGKCLQELESHGVFSRDESRSIFSRRMVRDEEVRKARAAGGYESQTNPSVPRRKDILPTILRPVLPPEDRRQKIEDDLKPDDLNTAERDEWREFVRNALVSYLGEQAGIPDDKIIQNVISAANGASKQEVQGYLRHLYQHGCGPNDPNGPRTFAWFPVVIRKHFSSQKPVEINAHHERNGAA